MKIFDHFQHINLTNDQRNALEKLQKGTPSMRLGHAKSPLDYTDITYFR